MDTLDDLGLWGDGDEVWAIEAAFEAIALEVPIEDAENWLTVGDVWHSATVRNPSLEGKAEAWNEFRQAISAETGVDWTRVGAKTSLIDGRGFNILSRFFTKIRELMSSNA